MLPVYSHGFKSLAKLSVFPLPSSHSSFSSLPFIGVFSTHGTHERRCQYPSQRNLTHDRRAIWSHLQLLELYFLFLYSLCSEDENSHWVSYFCIGLFALFFLSVQSNDSISPIAITKCQFSTSLPELEVKISILSSFYKMRCSLVPQTTQSGDLSLCRLDQ